MKSILKNLQIDDSTKGKNTLLNNLTKIPVKDSKWLMPTTQNPSAFCSEQIDLLHLPNDKGYRYLYFWILWTFDNYFILFTNYK